MNTITKAHPNLANGTTLLQPRVIRDPKSMIGDFLSRLWAIYGEPDFITFEGFSYTFKEETTGLIFTAYAAGSGPAFGGHYANRDQLLPIIQAFEQMLDQTEPADCEIEFNTDFGKMKSGAKDGIPYDRLEEG